MTSIEILATGRIDERDSAFPQSVQLPNGDVLCSFSVGGGQYVHGGTDWYRSKDRGVTWTLEGTLLPATENPPSANFLKLSMSADRRIIYAYGTRYHGSTSDKFGQRRGEAILCRSLDGGHTWTAPEVLPMPDMGLEISHSLRPLASGRLLAPAATLERQDRLGEEVFVLISDDGGKTWPHRRTVLRDPDGQLGFWEQKLTEVAPNQVLAVAWTVTLGEYQDRKNSFSWSHDGGWTWQPFRSTGIQGQTMTPLVLDDQRMLVLYNRRYGEQGIVAALVRYTFESWEVLSESLLYDARARRDRPAAATGVDELDSFQFGFPTSIRLDDGTILATHWCVERDVCGVRWTKFALRG